MFKRGDSVLVCVSGGPDSVFLLHTLAALKKKIGLQNIFVCNADHGLRGRESVRDSRFVKNLASSLSLKFFFRKLNLRKREYVSLSTEEAARMARYAFFVDVASRSGADVIATGHTLDDQAETVLMRVIKGSSLKGLAGVAPVRREKGLCVVRPLIEMERKEIEKYLNDKSIAYKVDSTNAKDIYFRNVVRNEIIPFLEKFNPRLKRSLSSLASHLRDDLEFIEAEIRRGKRSIRRKGPRISIALKDILLQPGSIRKDVLREMLDRSGGEVKKLNFRHWKELDNLLRRKGRGSAMHLPGGVKAVKLECSLEFVGL